MTRAVIGAGAFGTALAIALSQSGPVTLWGRDPMLAKHRQSPRLPGIELPSGVTVADDLDTALAHGTLLLAVPMQSLERFLSDRADPLTGRSLVACCKGIDLASMRGPSQVIATHHPDAVVAVLTGPSFAADIASGLPTALTLACTDDARGKALQEDLSSPTLRLYRTTDVIGAELGGALKNVIAIAAGAVIGAQLGDSARAALMTRGFAEMHRFAQAFGAQPDTLMGLSGLGDLTLTCMSEQSRNFRFGMALGTGDRFDPEVTVEGAATAQAVVRLAQDRKIDMPISQTVADLCAGTTTLAKAMPALLSRPLKPE